MARYGPFYAKAQILTTKITSAPHFTVKELRYQDIDFSNQEIAIRLYFTMREINNHPFPLEHDSCETTIHD
jgi:hypothetical protein